ncbi:hypothetical protein L1987_02224 [Smallanthus sonchifolius]|uniref:Uncharacterized protein n=1 Tax=Smallanthus sonchifolius TaxID=185202 RepID=A0ACB9K776_9ASTR|nr:hypothetical protein L1987_02224 [Smallanthus sonchifolius]
MVPLKGNATSLRSPMGNMMSLRLKRNIRSGGLMSIQVGMGKGINVAWGWRKRIIIVKIPREIIIHSVEDGGMNCGEYIPDTCEQEVASGRTQEVQIEPDEVEATIMMGKELGINSDNFEEMVRRVIEGEMETEVLQ